MKFETKDSGARHQYTSGMIRDKREDKDNFYLILPLDMPYSEQMLTRWAQLMTRGGVKYSPRNWEKAGGEAEYHDFKASAMRHFIQWICGETDEDHAAAVYFNIQGAEYVNYKMNKSLEGELQEGTESEESTSSKGTWNE